MRGTLSTTLRTILYIEDDAGLSRLLQKKLQRLDYVVDIAASAEEGAARLREQDYDLVLLDYYLPGMNGLQLLEQLQPPNDYPPIILLTSSGDERIAVMALEKGASDYAVKDAGQSYIDLLPAVMQSAFTKDRLMRENEQQRQALEDTMQRAEAANRAKSDFLATMSHEIRTPMNAVVGLSRLLMETPLQPKQKEMVLSLSSSADLLLKLINDLLDLSRIEAGQVQLDVQPFQLSQLCREVEKICAPQAAAKGIALTIHADTNDMRYVGDATRIKQVLLNLIGNGIKFTAQGAVTARLYESGHTSKNDGGDDVELRIEVQDTGIGIAKDKLAAVFEKFVQADTSITRRFGGSGLGLSISHSLVTLMGGTIALDSEAGRGTTFTVTLPLQRDTAPGVTIPLRTPDSDQAAATGHVMLVEDYPANVMVASLMLESMGFTVDVATSGEEAVEKMQAATSPYSAILMDVQMQGMDGFETTQRIRAIESEKGFSHHIIGVTAHALAGDREKCLDAGMNDYLSKPIHPELLAQKLAAAVA